MHSQHVSNSVCKSKGRGGNNLSRGWANALPPSFQNEVLHAYAGESDIILIKNVASYGCYSILQF